ncbi:MAG: hypothetical protein AAFR88_13070 [Pseudomonadota bacterium]
MSDQDSFRPDLRHRAKRAFEAAAPARRAQANRSARNPESVQGVERRVAQVREKVRAHQHKMMPKWVKAEVAKLRQANALKPSHAYAGGPKPPSQGPSRQFAREQSIAARALANVKKRCAQRILSIERVEHRMVRNLTRNRRHTQ